MAQTAALNWVTFIKALIALLLVKSWECHFPNPTYRFQDLTSSGTNFAFQFCENDFIYCRKPLQHFRIKRGGEKRDKCGFIWYVHLFLQTRLSINHPDWSVALPNTVSVLLQCHRAGVAMPPLARTEPACTSQVWPRQRVHVSLAAPGRCSGGSVQLEDPSLQGCGWCQWILINAAGRVSCDGCAGWDLCGTIMWVTENS